jgi:hypothetical protein
MLRYLLVEAAQTASIYDPELRRDYQRLKFRRGRGVAKVAIARKLAVRLYRKLREATRVAGSHAGQPGKSRGRRKPIVFLIERPASSGKRRRSSNRRIIVRGQGCA